METLTTPVFDSPDYDQTGKLSLDHVYNQPDPRDYFSTLQKLNYCVPGMAKPVFKRLLEARRQARGDASAKIVDVGCSYGINAALLKHDLTLDNLYALYGDEAPDSPDQLIERDRALFADAADGNLSVVGVDAAENAISYAVETGLLDAGVSANLEREEPSGAALGSIEGSDMIISTGCVGYVTSTSLQHLVDASRGRSAWMANFVLRMFDYEPVEAMMAERGYVTEKLDGILFPQRQFVSPDEQAHVFDNLDNLGLTPEDAERDGWYLAELYVSRPAREASLPIDFVLNGR